jgi:hypothetical protein
LCCKVIFLRTLWMAEMNVVAIKFSYKAGLFLTETLTLVQKAFENEALNRSNVSRRYSQFRDGRELVEMFMRGGRPKLT